jgi:predicted secreted protein
MNWVLLAALFFVTWWLMLFVVLPFSLRTQDDDKDVTLGTVSSAPRGPHMRRAFLRATIATVLVMGTIYGLTTGLGFSFDDIMRIMPDFTPDVRH